MASWIVNWKECCRKRPWFVLRKYLSICLVQLRNHEKPHLLYPASGHRIKCRTYRIWSRSVSCWTMMLSIRGEKKNYSHSSWQGSRKYCESNWSVKLTAHFSLAWEFKIHGAVHPAPICLRGVALNTWGRTLSFTIIITNEVFS